MSNAPQYSPGWQPSGPMMPPPRVPWYSTRKGTKALIGAASGVVVVIVAVVLVIALVIAPNQRAAQAAASASAASASASAQAAQDYQAAVTAFNSAASACTSANGQLATAIKTAQTTAKTDPSTLQDPTLIDKLNQAITTAQAIKACAPPTMASDTATIQQQTTQLGTDTQAVTTAASTLAAASQAVPASVQAKQQAAAQAQAQAAAAAQQGSGTWTDPDGYSYAISWSGVKYAATIDTTQGKPGQLVVSYSVSGSVTVKNTTPGKNAPVIWVVLEPIYPASVFASLCATSIDSRGDCPEGALGGQQVGGWWDINTNYVARSVPSDGNPDSNEIIPAGGSDIQTLMGFSPGGATFQNNRTATFETTTSAAQLASQFEAVAGWGMTIIVGAEGISAQGSFCTSSSPDSGPCFLAVSDSLSGN